MRGTAGWTFQVRVPVGFGAGCMTEVPSSLGAARRVLVVTGRKAMRAAGVTAQLVSILEEKGTACGVFDGLSAEPEHTEIAEAARQARALKADAIIALGGGSAIDGAKAVAVAATHPGPIMDYVVNGPRVITAATLPIVAITSTSGTGSHVGRVAVLSDRARGIKRSLISDSLFPRAAFCDPQILRTMPKDVTASAGFDAFAQALEGFLSNVEHPLGCLCAREAMRLIHATLPRALQDGGDLSARSDMGWADTMAGVSLATNAVITPHALAMVLGGRYGIPHGRAVASVTVACLGHSRPGAQGKLAVIARLLGLEGRDEGSLANDAIQEIERFMAGIGVRHSLRDLGVAEDDLQSVAEEARAVFGARIDADPVPADVAGLRAILDTAWAGP